MLIDGFPEVFVPPSDDFVPEPGSADYNIEDLDLPDCINLENLPDGIVASDLDGIPEDLLRSVYYFKKPKYFNDYVVPILG